MRKDVRMGGDASDLYSPRWKRWLGSGKRWAAIRRQYHKQERAAARKITSRNPE